MRHDVLLVDGMALLFRGYYATAYRHQWMKTSQGIPTNGVYQFLRYFLGATHTFQPKYVICCWDMGSQTFRNQIYRDYKANRPAPPKELIPQFELVKEVVSAFDIPNIGIENYEADDCIGTLAHDFKKQHEVLILSGDQDLLQLVDSNISVALMKKGMGNYDVYHQRNFYEKKGLEPKQIIDMKALVGDPADHYPGVKGIGEKTALKLLKEYETIEHLLENKDQLSERLKANLEEDIDMLYISRELATIKCDVPISCTLDEAIWQFNQEKVEDTLKALDIKPPKELYLSHIE